MIKKILFISLLMTLCTMGTLVLAEEEVEFSQAETLLWMTNQLDDISDPMTLHYSFKKRGSFEQGFEDVVEFNVEKIHEDGMKSASLKA